MDISVIVPLYNEAESLPELTAWIERVMEENKFSYEIWFINDGSTDDSWQVIESLREKNSRVKGEIPAELWQISGALYRISKSRRRCRYYYGCRFARQPR